MVLRIFTTRVSRQTNVLLLFIIASGMNLLAQDSTSTTSLYSRLKSVTNIGLSADERLNGFTISVYSPEQQNKNVESLLKYRADLATFNDTIAAIDKRAVEARSRFLSGDANALIQERNDLQSTRPSSPFGDGRISLHRIVAVAVDYIEIESIDDSENTTLIPLHKVCRVIVKKPSATLSLNNTNKK